MRVSITWVLALGVVLALLCAEGARADNKQAARDFYKEGSKLYDLMDYRGALEAFKKAYVNFEEPTLLFNIAQCHRYLGQKGEAVVTYKNYLRKSPNAPNADEVRKLIAQIEGAMDQERRASTAPPSGTLAPAASRNDPTARSVASVQSKPAEPKPAAASSKPTSVEPAAVEPTPAAVEPASTTVTARRSDGGTPLIKKWWLWTAVGGGVVVIAVAVGLGVGLSGGESPYVSTGAGTVIRF